jgi:hypothetical protein
MAVRNRRRLYTHGALMVLAPLGVAGCSGSTSEGNTPPASGNDASSDVASDKDAAPQEAAPEVIAVVPYDAGPDALMVAPADGPIAIAPPADAGYDGPLMIAPPDDAGFDGPLMIAPPPDAKAEGGQGDTCQIDDDCTNTLFCEAIPCIIACDPSCQPLPCDPQNSKCPDSSKCELVGSDYQCVRK